MFEGIEPSVVKDAEAWLYAHGYHHQGDFRVQFAHGGHVDLREIAADFASLHNSALLGRVHAWQRVAEAAVNVNPTPPISEDSAPPETRPTQLLCDVENRIADKMHELYGICGHCGKKKCHGKAEHSKLPQWCADGLAVVATVVCKMLAESALSSGGKTE